MSERTNELIIDIIAAAQGVATAYEWGSGTKQDKDDLICYKKELIAIIAALEAENARLKAAAAWHPASKPAPHHKVVWAHGIAGHYGEAFYNAEYDTWYWNEYYTSSAQIDYWRELPELPALQEEVE